MSSFIPNPLHPAIVHLPIALAVLLPLFAAGALWMIQRGSKPRAAWGLTTGLLAALAVSAWVATETGEQQEERVDAVVSEPSFGTHEEAADLFLTLSVGVLPWLPRSGGRCGGEGRTRARHGGHGGALRRRLARGGDTPATRFAAGRCYRT